MTTTIIWVPIAVTVAALIAGIVSLIALVIAKENKVSELRQEWIDALRDEGADFMGTVFVLDSSPQRDLPDTTQRHEKLSISAQKIILRLNPDEADTKSAATLKSLEKVRGPLNSGNVSAARKEIPEFRGNLQKLLKSEWQRVKAGEPFFKFLKCFLVIIIILIVLTLVFLAFFVAENPELLG